MVVIIFKLYRLYENKILELQFVDILFLEMYLFQ